MVIFLDDDLDSLRLTAEDVLKIATALTLQAEGHPAGAHSRTLDRGGAARRSWVTSRPSGDPASTISRSRRTRTSLDDRRRDRAAG